MTHSAPRRLSTGRTAIRRIVPLALVLAVAAACGPDPAVAPDATSDIALFVALMNQHRVDVGCPELTWNADVAAVAQAHSEDMVARSFFAHTNPDGDSPFDRLANAGIDFSAAAENIAYGYPTPQAVLDAWLASDGHRANIENCALTEHGVGPQDAYWTPLFIRP